jgi:hypothetical protein
MQVHAALGPFLERIHAASCQACASQLSIDMCGLCFVNSSCLRLFVVWLGRVAALEGTKRYRVVFVTDPDRPWQRRTVEAMRAFAPDIVVIEEA